MGVTPLSKPITYLVIYHVTCSNRDEPSDVRVTDLGKGVSIYGRWGHVYGIYGQYRFIFPLTMEKSRDTTVIWTFTGLMTSLI